MCGNVRVLHDSVIVNSLGVKYMSKVKICQYGKEVKKKLVDIDQTQEWLIGKVGADTGLYFDSSYLYKIMTGRLATPSIVSSICRILEIDPPKTTDGAQKGG